MARLVRLLAPAASPLGNGAIFEAPILGLCALPAKDCIPVGESAPLLHDLQGDRLICLLLVSPGGRGVGGHRKCWPATSSCYAPSESAHARQHYQ